MGEIRVAALGVSSCPTREGVVNALVSTPALSRGRCRSFDDSFAVVDGAAAEVAVVWTGEVCVYIFVCECVCECVGLGDKLRLTKL